MTSAITEIQKGGYFVEVSSWENDLDFPRVQCMGGLSKEEAQAIREVCGLFAPFNYQENKNAFGNTDITVDDCKILFDYSDFEDLDYIPAFDTIFEIADKYGVDQSVVREGVKLLIGAWETEVGCVQPCWRVVQWVRVLVIYGLEVEEIF